MKNKKANGAIIVLIIILVIIVVWGLIGGAEAQSIGTTCDFGIGNSMCWAWHKNAIGKAGEAISSLF